MARIRAGVIGLGMGKNHARAYAKHDRSELVAIADLDENRLKTVGDELGVPQRYTSPEDMIAKANLDVVCIATPNTLHKPLTLAALEAGCHVLCEKPMAMNAAEARDMLAAADRASKRLMINFSFRFRNESMAMKRAVDEGMLGDIYYARTVWMRRRGMPGFGGWFGQKALSGGGPLIDLGVHRLDLALWLMGYPKPTWVLGRTYDPIASRIAAEQGKSFDCEDFAAAMVTFENGASLHLTASWASHIRQRDEISTQLLGTKGGLEQVLGDDGEQVPNLRIYRDEAESQFDMVYRNSWLRAESAMAHFSNCILDDQPHIATAHEGLVVMELLDAVYQSAQTGAPVQIGT